MLHECLKGSSIELIEFGKEYLSIKFSNTSAMTIYSEYTIKINSNKKPIEFIEIEEFEDRFEMKFSENSIISVSKFAQDNPETFVFISAEGDYIVD